MEVILLVMIGPEERKRDHVKEAHEGVYTKGDGDLEKAHADRTHSQDTIGNASPGERQTVE
jgi:hypothetical protein